MSERAAQEATERAVAKQSEPATGPASAAERRGNPPDSLPFSAADATEQHLADVEATQAAGARLGALLRAGDVLAATGDLGAGKTSFAQGLARGLGVPPGHYVNSPTFALLQSHPGRVPFHHIDLYRISDPDELMGLGLEDLLGGEGVAYVEWPQRALEVLPPDVLWVSLAHAGAGRRLRLVATGARSAALVAQFAEGLPGR